MILGWFRDTKKCFWPSQSRGGPKIGTQSQFFLFFSDSSPNPNVFLETKCQSIKLFTWVNKKFRMLVSQTNPLLFDWFIILSNLTPFPPKQIIWPISPIWNFVLHFQRSKGPPSPFPHDWLLHANIWQVSCSSRSRSMHNGYSYLYIDRSIQRGHALSLHWSHLVLQPTWLERLSLTQARKLYPGSSSQGSWGTSSSLCSVRVIW